ncbi:MAG: PH domain-containing protein [Hyphomonadaceae bacterium]|nr:PH domain-containing protein [Hyphomonadaceae bacterium]
MTYRKRRNALSRGEREWRIDEDALYTRGPTGRVRRYPWRDIVSVRLCCEPKRGRPWRYVFELQPKHRRRIEIDNSHFMSPGVFEDRSSTYTPFVRAALTRLADAKPGMRALIGETPRRYFFLLLGALAILSALVYALALVPTPLDQWSYAPLLKLAVIAFLIIAFWRWVVGVVPRGVALDQIPERALPNG